MAIANVSAEGQLIATLALLIDRWQAEVADKQGLLQQFEQQQQYHERRENVLMDMQSNNQDLREELATLKQDRRQMIEDLDHMAVVTVEAKQYIQRARQNLDEGECTHPGTRNQLTAALDKLSTLPPGATRDPEQEG